MNTQRCLVCEEEKPLSEYHYRNDNKKYRPMCKPCRNMQEQGKRYGITMGELQQMLEQQENRCAICNTHVSEIPHKSFGNPLVVDHCHSSGKVRGLLCPTCNSGLGHFKDSPQLLLEAVRYLIDKQ